MANKKSWLGILVMVLVFGTVIVGCDNGTTGENTYIPTGKFEGTYDNGMGLLLVFSGNTFVISEGATEKFRGTFTYDATTITFTVTSGVNGSGVVISMYTLIDTSLKLFGRDGTALDGLGVISDYEKSDLSKFEGTYDRAGGSIGLSLVFSGNTFAFYENDNVTAKHGGTFTYDATTITFTVTSGGTAGNVKASYILTNTSLNLTHQSGGALDGTGVYANYNKTL